MERMLLWIPGKCFTGLLTKLACYVIWMFFRLEHWCKMQSTNYHKGSFLMLFFSSAHTWMLWHSWGSVTYMVKPWGGVLVVIAWWPEHWQLSSQEGPRVWFPVTDNVLLSFYSGYLQLQFLLQHRTMTYNLDNRRRERKGAKDRAVSRLLWRYLSVGRAKNGNL